jgi:TPR repeat protein
MAANTYNIGHIFVSLALAAYTYTRFRLPGCWRWHFTAVCVAESSSGASQNWVASFHSFPVFLDCLWVSRRGDTSMSFLTRATVAAFFLFALLSAARPQVLVLTARHPSAQAPSDDFDTLRVSAAAGDAQAQFGLANHYYGGLGVPQDYRQALLWYSKSANQGFAPAQTKLGSMYQHKWGVPRDYKRALAYYRSAAKQGDALAEYDLGAIFEDGVGVKRDYKQALDWYRKAAGQNLGQAEKQVGYFYQCGYAVKQDLTQAYAWYLRAAGHGNSDAENQLGFFAEEGWGQPKNYAEALAWFNKAAEHGSHDAEENIGYMFQNGIGVPTDYAKAMSWFVEAAAHGNSNAENQLGWMYQYGQGVAPDDARALSWYQMSAAQGNIHGQKNVEDFTSDLDDRGAYQSATARVNDAALARAERWVKMDDLQRRIAGLEGDAQDQDDLAYQFEHMGKGKNDAVTEIFNAIGSVPATKYHIEAAKYRAEAAQLREELAQIENQSTASVSAP